MVNETERLALPLLLIGVVMIIALVFVAGKFTNVQQSIVGEKDKFEYTFPQDGSSISIGDLTFSPLLNSELEDKSVVLINGGATIFQPGETKTLDEFLQISYTPGRDVIITHFDGFDVDPIKIKEGVFLFDINVDKILEVNYLGKTSYPLSVNEEVLIIEINNKWDKNLRGGYEYVLESPGLLTPSIRETKSVGLLPGRLSTTQVFEPNQIGEYTLKLTPFILVHDSTGDFTRMSGTTQVIDINVQPIITGGVATTSRISGFQPAQLIKDSIIPLLAILVGVIVIVFTGIIIYVRVIKK